MSQATTKSQFPRETAADGSFRRQTSAFRDHVRADGSTDFPAEAGRYHLYVSLACPWAHRTILVRRIKGLEDAIGMSVVDPIRDERGWRFTEGDGHGPDPVNGFGFLSEAYTATDPSFDGRVTVPVLWDKESGRVVNNESSEILRMLNAEFDAWGDASVDLYPEALRAEIDEVNTRVYDDVNNGVYRCGFATTQEAYDEAFARLFAALDWLEERLDGRRWLVGESMTEADIRLFTTLVRFDPVYVGHFKCNRYRIADRPNLQAFLDRMLAVPGVRETVDLDHIKRHYYVTHTSINPTGIVPRGPELAWS